MLHRAGLKRDAAHRLRPCPQSVWCHEDPRQKLEEPAAGASQAVKQMLTTWILLGALAVVLIGVLEILDG